MLGRAAAVAVLWGGWVAPLAAADEADVEAAVARVEESVGAAREMLSEGLPGDAGLLLADALLALQEVADLGRAVEPDTIRRLAAGCEEVSVALMTEGVSIEGMSTPLQLLRRRADAMRRESQRGSASPMPMKQPAGPSFATQIAPMLVRACGRCHVDGSRGDFSMRSYATLGQSGMVIPGDGPTSRLVEVIRTGDMPRGGGNVSAEEFAALVAWIEAGAVFDGADPTVSLDQVRPASMETAGNAPDTPAAEPPSTEIGPDEVPFSSAIAGVLVENCLRCHGGRNPSAGLSMDTFADLADSGVMEAGRGEESLLVRKLLGVDIDGQRMPRGRPPLPDETIAVVQQWIDEGARLDMLDGTAELTRIASEGRSKNLSHDELKAVRFEAAPELWRRGIVDEEGAVEVRGDLCVVGNLDGPRLAAMADAAAAIEGQLEKKLRISGPLAKGGVAVFAFARGYDFSNFWQNVMGRERPRGLLGHAGVSGDVVYAAVAFDNDVDNGRLMLAAELTAAVLRSRGAPPWFAEAAGQRVARSLVADASMLAIWDDAALVAKTAPPPNPERFFSAPLSAEQLAIASAMLATVDREGGRLPGMISRLEKGEDFEAAFRQTYRGTPEQMLTAWISRGR